MANRTKKVKEGIKPNFVLTLKLDTENYQEDILDKRLDIGRRIYNACLNELNKRYRLMVESKEYQSVLKMPKTDTVRNLALQELNSKYRLTEYSLHQFVKPMQHHYRKNLDSHTVQKIATRCFEAFKGKIYHTANKIHFKKYGELQSLEGKTNSSGIKFRNNSLVWNGLSIKVLVYPSDVYAQMVLLRPIKYCRVLKSGINYFLQLVLEGVPPVKLDKNGEFRHKVGRSKVGIDIGPQTAGITSDEKVSLLELAPEIDTPYRKIRKLQRKMDRSRRANNPNKYKANGTFNRSNKDHWVKSKHYQSDQLKLQRIQSKLRCIRKQSHNSLANEIISLGTEVNVERMSFKGLQKRAKKTTKNEKGKIKSKKRFGKSLANKAPAMFLTILDNKLKHLGTELHRIKTAEVKASQSTYLRTRRL
ncbi:MAG: hypothetical protein APF81_00585 [Desulfosporosinus sp. BRH_c37]|nr:MAG: hypothetical protein APF81_00585 [Desulfosporosinus sp. BRH_c37]